MITSTATGRAGVIGQQDVTIFSRSWHPDNTKHGGVACHFAGGSALTFLTPPYTDKPQAIVLAGIPLISGDEDGSPAQTGFAWGNDSAIATVDTLRAYVQSPWPGGLGAKTDKILLFGESMGGLLALNYARLNPTKVAAIAVIVPVIDLAWTFANYAAGSASIAASVGGSSNLTPAYYSTHSPIQYATQLAGIPIKIWYGQTDPITPEATTRQFAGLCGATVVNMGSLTTGNPTGHDPNPASGVDVANFLATYA